LSDAGDPTIGDPAPKIAKTLIARMCPFPFTMVSEPLVTAVPVQILKVILPLKNAEIAVFPNGLSGPQSGTAFLAVLGVTNTTNFAVGKTGLAWRLPDGTYVSDVFAQ
jgi:hypothetical protein